ncbi:MAG: hemolysin family protein [Magnetococcus sp. YQC-5]
MELFILLSMILLNGLFSMSEMAVVSARKVRLRQMADSGSVGARVALDLVADPSRFLATIQVGITTIGILSGAYGEAVLLGWVVPLLEPLPMVGDHANDVGMVIIVVGITFCSLILGELLPKRVAMHYPEMLATMLSKPMRLLSRLAAPFIFLLTKTTDGLMGLLGISHRNDPPVTNEEIQVLMQQGAEAGVFEQHEHFMVKRVLQLDSRRISDIMTPRMEIETLNLTDTLEVNLKRIAESRFSLFPVCQGGLDQVVGVLNSTLLLKKTITHSDIDLAVLARPPVFIPATLSIARLMDFFRRDKTGMLLVVDEFGGVAGVVTFTDLIEEMVGELEDSATEKDQSVVQREDGSLLLDGLVDLERLRELTGIASNFPQEDEGGYRTLAGLMMILFERIPIVGDCVSWGGVNFEVVDMDNNRVDRILVTPHPANSGKKMPP